MSTTDQTNAAKNSKGILFVSDATDSEHPISQYLQRQGDTITRCPSSVEAAIHLSRQSFQLIIADDTKTCSSIATLLHLNESPFALATPAIPILLESRNSEFSFLQKYGYPVVLPRTAPIGTVENAIRKNEQIWSTVEYRKLHQIAAIGGFESATEQKQIFEILVPLLKNELMNSVAARILARIQCRLGKIKEAEKILLAAVRNQPKNPANLIALATYYIKFSRSALAVQLLQRGMITHGPSAMFKYPLCQAFIVLGQYGEAITILKMLRRDEFQVQEVGLALAKLHLATGDRDEAEKYLATISELRGIDLWQEDETFQVAG